MAPEDIQSLGRLQYKIGNRSNIVSGQHWHGGIFDRIVRHNGFYGGVFSRQLRIVETLAPQLQLGMVTVLVSLHQHYVCLTQTHQQLIHCGLLRFAELPDMRPALRRSHDNFACAGLTVLVTVLAGVINIKIVVRMLECCDPQTAATQLAYQLHHQRGFTGIFEPRDTKNSHAFNRCQQISMQRL